MNKSKPLTRAELALTIESFTNNEYERNVLKARFMDAKTFKDIIGYTPSYPYQEEEIKLCKRFGTYMLERQQ